jgi:hypothetical protein
MNPERTQTNRDASCLRLEDLNFEDIAPFSAEETAKDTDFLPPEFYQQGYQNLLMGRGNSFMTSCADIPDRSVSTLSTASTCSVSNDTNGLNAATSSLSIDGSDYESLGFEQGLNYELIPAEEIQSQWNQVLADSNKQVTQQSQFQARQAEKEKMKKLERLLTMALNGGNLDMAMLLFSALETSQANDMAGSLLNRMKELQEQRTKLGNQVAELGTDKAQEAQKLNNTSSDLNTEIQFLQTFLQDVMSHKAEAQQMSSNFIKSRHDTAMGIIRNMG